MQTRIKTEEYKVDARASSTETKISHEQKEDANFNNYKKYLLWVTFIYLVNKITNPTEIRTYRDKEVRGILTAINSCKTIDSLKENIKEILETNQHPGIFKSTKRMFHQNEFPIAMSKALEEGENKAIHQIMNSINMKAEKLIEFLTKVSEGNSKYKIAYRAIQLFKPKEKYKGNDPGFFKRYLYLTMYKFIINAINNNEEVPQEIKNYLQKIIKLFKMRHPAYPIQDLKIHMIKIKKEEKDNLIETQDLFQRNLGLLPENSEEKIFLKKELESLEIINIKLQKLFTIIDQAIVAAEDLRLQNFMGYSRIPLECFLTSLEEAVGNRKDEFKSDNSPRKS